MPLDPSIPLQVRPMQFKGFGQSMREAQSLRDMAQQRQLRGIQMESEELGLQEQKAKIGENQRLAEAQKAWATIPRQHIIKDENGEPEGTDDAAIMNAFGEAGFPELAQKWEETAPVREKALFDRKQTLRAMNKADMEDFVKEAEVLSKKMDRPRVAALIGRVNAGRKRKGLDMIPLPKTPEESKAALADIMNEGNTWLTTETERIDLEKKRREEAKAASELEATKGKEQAGELIPGTDFYTPEQEKAALFRVKQADGTYKNEMRVIGKAGPAPASPQAPMSPERFTQEQTLRRESAAASKTTTAEDIKDTAQAIAEGKLSPKISQTVSFRDRTQVSAELHRLGYNQAAAERDWTAINRHLLTLNGAQQERLRQAITFTYDSLDQLESAYAEWKKQAGVSGYRIANKATLAAMRQLPGAPGSAAQQLESLIADLTSELGTVYKGGNSSTDESLRLAAQNLGSDWNEKTFNDSLKRLRESLQIRRNSITTSEAVGVTPDSPYLPPVQGATIRVQIPGQDPGEIDADQWEAFKAKYKDAVRLQ